jgi:hypothetical protein
MGLKSLPTNHLQSTSSFLNSLEGGKLRGKENLRGFCSINKSNNARQHLKKLLFLLKKVWDIMKLYNEFSDRKKIGGNIGLDELIVGLNLTFWLIVLIKCLVMAGMRLNLMMGRGRNF